MKIVKFYNHIINLDSFVYAKTAFYNYMTRPSQWCLSIQCENTVILINYENLEKAEEMLDELYQILANQD